MQSYSNAPAAGFLLLQLSTILNVASAKCKLPLHNRPTDHNQTNLTSAAAHHPISDEHDPTTTSFLSILSNPPTSWWKFILSLLLLGILTALGQRFATEIFYWIGWVNRRLQGDSAHEEGKQVPGFDSDDEDGEVEYAVNSELGKVLDYVVAVDDSPASRANRQAGGQLRGRKGRKEVGV